MGEALGKLFPGFEADLGDRVGVGGEGPEPGTAPPTDPNDPTSPAELLARADELLQEAEDALPTEGLAGYEQRVQEASALIDQALAAIGEEPDL